MQEPVQTERENGESSDDGDDDENSTSVVNRSTSTPAKAKPAAVSKKTNTQTPKKVVNRRNATKDLPDENENCRVSEN